MPGGYPPLSSNDCPAPEVAVAGPSGRLQPESTQSGCRVIVVGTTGIDPVRTPDTYVGKGGEVNTGAEVVYRLGRVSIG
jgi:hypothetical protein